MGTIISTDAVKKAYAKASNEYNMKNQVFRKHFEDLLVEATAAPSTAAPSAPSSSAPSSSAPSTPSTVNTTTTPTTPSPTTVAPNPAPAAPAVAPAGPAAPNQAVAGAKPVNKAATSKQREKDKKDQTICRAIVVMVAVALVAIWLNRWL